MEWLSGVLDALKSPPTKLLIVVAAGSLLLLLLPHPALERLHLARFVEHYGTVIGLAALVSVVYLVLELCIKAKSVVSSWRARRDSTARLHDALGSLDEEELAVLREFHLSARNTLKLPVIDPAVAHLIGSGILEKVSTLGERSRLGPLFPLVIASAVRRQVTRRFVGLPDRQLTDTEEEHFRSRRPSFTPTLNAHGALFTDLLSV